MRHSLTTILLCLVFNLAFILTGNARTTAVWLFDEPVGLYPSHVLDDSSENDYPLSLGLGGHVVPGKYGNALSTRKQEEIQVPEGEVRFGLRPVAKPKGRTIDPMTWKNANFCALMTSGENHLRKEVGFVNASQSKLNIGDFDWTIEFWLQPSSEQTEGCVFEIGQGPRGENRAITLLLLNKERDSFTFYNAPSNTEVSLKTDKNLLKMRDKSWYHVAFTYSKTEKSLKHYLNGEIQDAKQDIKLKQLAVGGEAYMSIGRDGLWEKPLPGAIDELRFSEGIVYTSNFDPPQSFSPGAQVVYPELALQKGPPLLFLKSSENDSPIQLMDRKHLFIDDALLAKIGNVEFNVNPPRRAERVIDDIDGPFRKHLTVVEDEEGRIRIYNSIQNDFLAVRTSKNGVNFEEPNINKEYRGPKNIVIHEKVGGLGNPFIDPNGLAKRRWKYISDYHRRGIYVYTSPDGYNWTRHKTAYLPFRSGSQSSTFYDDQRQLYVGYHRTGIFKTPAGATQRRAVLTESKSLFEPLKYQPLSQKKYREAAADLPLREPRPWYLDNGPLTPGGFGLEFPHKFAPIKGDPVGTDIYATKAQKYPWAPDTYLAFPIVYFHYERDGPATRQILADAQRARGSGTVETQLSVSRDGVNWKRYPRPAYVGIGVHEKRDVHTAYIAHGMVRRGDEIWQYYFGESQYHSAHKRNPGGRGVYRLVQRLDGFISIDSPYDTEEEIITKPIIFKGNRLVLNIDTNASGYAQVGFLDKEGKPIEGFSVDDCIYLNGDFIETEVEWFPNQKNFTKYDGKKIKARAEASDEYSITKDVSSLEGKVVQIVFRMRGAKLYSMQFVEK
jgi:hypothetical protein